MTHGRVIARTTRTLVETDELLAIRLVKLWEEFDMLCCNNTVMSPAGHRTDDQWQLIYMCIRRR